MKKLLSVICFSCALLPACNSQNEHEKPTPVDSGRKRSSIDTSTPFMRYLLIFMTFFLFRNEAYSQRYDSLEYRKVQINGIYTTVTKKELVHTFGKPQKITKYVSDDNDDQWLEYHYGRTILEVLADGRFYGFELRTPAFVFQYGECKVKVGDPLSLLERCFPGSYKWLKIEKSDVLRVQCKGTDGYVHFYSKNGVITSIATWNEL